MIETSLSNKDILYESMKSAIEKFYDEEFSNGGKRGYHLNLLHSNYNRARFENCSNIKKNDTSS